jgi:hypothetical protein
MHDPNQALPEIDTDCLIPSSLDNRGNPDSQQYQQSPLCK